MAKASRQRETSEESMSNGSGSSEEEQIVNDVNEEEEDEEEIEAVARTASSDEDEVYAAEDGPHSPDDDAVVELEEEEGGNVSQIGRREKTRLKEMEKLKPQKIQEILDAQNSAIDADMNKKGKGRLKYLLQQTEIFAHFAKGGQSAAQKKGKGRMDIAIKPVIGLSWEPKVTFPSVSSSSKYGSQNIPETSSSTLWKPTNDLVDGLFVPPNNPRDLNKLRRKVIKDTAGSNWFDMPAPTMTPKVKKDLQLLQLRNVIDPKRHYKKGDSKSKTLPKYFQIGTVVDTATDFYTGRLTRKERKATIAEELLSSEPLRHYRKRKVQEIEKKSRPGGVDKWNIKGKQSKHAKQRRH